MVSGPDCQEVGGLRTLLPGGRWSQDLTARRSVVSGPDCQEVGGLRTLLPGGRGHGTGRGGVLPGTGGLGVSGEPGLSGGVAGAWGCLGAPGGWPRVSVPTGVSALGREKLHSGGGAAPGAPAGTGPCACKL